MTPLHLAKLAKIIGKVGSVHDPEALTALRMAGRLLHDAGMGWEDLLVPFRQLAIATEAAAVLLRENTELQAELDRLRSTGAAIATWQDVGAAVSDTCAAAAWALDLHRRGSVWLSTFEVQFLNTCTAWTGRLTAKQRPILEQIMGHIVDCTGQTPPA